jgi:hypothetical protein
MSATHVCPSLPTTINTEGDPRRSPSPEPVYDKNGVRLNTREIR